MEDVCMTKRKKWIITNDYFSTVNTVIFFNTYHYWSMSISHAVSNSLRSLWEEKRCQANNCSWNPYLLLSRWKKNLTDYLAFWNNAYFNWLNIFSDPHFEPTFGGVIFFLLFWVEVLHFTQDHHIHSYISSNDSTVELPKIRIPYADEKLHQNNFGSVSKLLNCLSYIAIEGFNSEYSQ